MCCERLRLLDKHVIEHQWKGWLRFIPFKDVACHCRCSKVMLMIIMFKLIIPINKGQKPKGSSFILTDIISENGSIKKNLRLCIRVRSRRLPGKKGINWSEKLIPEDQVFKNWILRYLFLYPATGQRSSKIKH